VRRAALAAKEAELASAESELASATARGAAAAARAAKARERLQDDEAALAALHAEANNAARAAAAAQVRGLRSVPAPARVVPGCTIGPHAAVGQAALLRAHNDVLRAVGPPLSALMSRMMLRMIPPGVMPARGAAGAATRTQAQAAGGAAAPVGLAAPPACAGNGLCRERHRWTAVRRAGHAPRSLKRLATAELCRRLKQATCRRCVTMGEPPMQARGAATAAEAAQARDAARGQAAAAGAAADALAAAATRARARLAAGERERAALRGLREEEAAAAARLTVGLLSRAVEMVWHVPRCWVSVASSEDSSVTPRQRLDVLLPVTVY